jgi:hypothetical protein
MEQWETELTCLAIDATQPRDVLYAPVLGYMGAGPIVPMPHSSSNGAGPGRQFSRPCAHVRCLERPSVVVIHR